MAVARGDEGSNYSNPHRPTPAHYAEARRTSRCRRSSGEPRQSAPVLISPPSAPGREATRLDDLYRLPMPKLFALAEREGIAEHTGMNRGQLIVGIVRRQIERGDVVRGSGTLEVLPDGYGFLRSAAHNYLASPEDIYVSPSQIRRMGLQDRPGRRRADPPADRGPGQLRPDAGRAGQRPAPRTSAIVADDLRRPDAAAPEPPARSWKPTAEELDMRVVDLVTPIGKGQRGLIVSPPRAGKTILLAEDRPQPSSRTIPNATSSCCSSTSGRRK